MIATITTGYALGLAPRPFMPPLAAALAGFAALGFSCASTSSPGARSPPGVAVGQPMPDVTVKSLAGDRNIRLGGGGRVVLLDIWASWCGPCKEELPLLDAMAARVIPMGVEIIAVNIDEEKANAEEFLRRRSAWVLTLAHDPEGRVPDLLQPPKLPTSYVIDSEGWIREINAGFDRSDLEKIEARLVELAGRH